VTSLDPAVRDLATALGVATEYWDWQGRHVEVQAETVVPVLAALGVDASTADSAAAALAEQRLRRWRQVLPDCTVVRSGRPGRVWVHVPHEAPVRLWVVLEDGGTRHDTAQVDHWVEPQPVDGTLVGEATFALPGDLPLGWHALHAQSGDGPVHVAPLVVTPDRLSLPTALRDRRAWGFMTQLYQVRSRRSWGLGDLADLADLAGWSGHDLGAGFVLVNPLHAAAPSLPVEPSPYLPATRRFASPLYLRPEAVPEAAYLAPDERARLAALAASAQRPAAPAVAARGAGPTMDLLARDPVWVAKRQALDLLATVPLSPGRAASLDAYVRREGPALLDFATWCALVEQLGTPWLQWPAELRDPRSAAVAAERERLAGAVRVHLLAQWWLDEQLATAQRTAREAGMAVGVVHDLAVGVHPEGFETWALGDVLAPSVYVGAPADQFNEQGQGWSQPPWRPDRLAAAGYAPYRDMLRAVLRHSGGVRVDHVLGLFRLWWVPRGLTPALGTYVRYDHEALVGILALEAHRAGALVVGEDLGTVEPWMRDLLADRGILGTSVLWFERDHDGRPLPPEHWRALCLATVTTHDLPPTAGYLAGEHLRIRAELGLLTRGEEAERAVDAAEREAWMHVLSERGLLREGAAVREIVEALHRLVATTPSRLVGVALTDAVGEVAAQNQPGTSTEYPNWCVPLADGEGRPVLLEDVVESARVRSLARAVSGG
jgi:4-alpha-glucanotransferase